MLPHPSCGADGGGGRWTLETATWGMAGENGVTPYAAAIAGGLGAGGIGCGCSLGSTGCIPIPGGTATCCWGTGRTGSA